MKQLIIILILLASLSFGQSGKSVLTQAQKDSIGAMISDSSYIVNAKSFGVVGDGITDDAPALQSAIESCLYGNKRTLVLEAGKTYLIDSPLIIANFSGSSYSYAGDIHIIGGSPPYASLTSLKQAKIKTSYNDLPAIIIQNGRNIIIENIYLEGQNDFADYYDYGQLFEGADSLYVSNGCRDNGRSPHAGIAIDPFMNTTTNGYPGLESYYTGLGTGGSSHIKIKNVYFTKFVVGLMATSGSVSQGEQVLAEDCNFSNLKVAWAVGQPQSKNCYLVRPTIYNVNTIIDCYNYGRGIGVAPYFQGGNITTVKAFYRTNSLGYNSSIHCSDVFGELVYSLGYFSGSGGMPVAFTGCSIKFFVAGTGADLAYEPTAILYASDVPIIFNSCYLGKYSNSPYKMNFFSASPITFIGCTFDDIPFAGDAYTYNKIVHINSRFKYSNYNNAWIPFTSGFTGSISSWIEAKYIPPHTTITKGNTVYTDTYHFDRTAMEYLALGTFTGYSRGLDRHFVFDIDSVGKVKTGDMVIAYASTQTMYNTIDKGYDSGTLATVQGVIGKVDSVVGTRVTCIGSSKQDTSTYYLGVWRNPLFHTRNFGDVTSGSNIITNCTLTSTWTVGQRIKGYGIPNGAYVTAKTATTLTISLYATSSRTQCNLYDAFYWVERRTSAIPTTDGWTPEDLVEYRPPFAYGSISELGTTPNKYTLKGWKRLTTGTANVLNTDWVEERIPTGN